MAGGIVMTEIGGSLVLVGLGYLAMGDTQSCTAGVCYGQDYTKTGATISVTGLVAAALGIPLVVSGAKHVPARHSAAPALDVRARIDRISLRVTF